MAKLAFIVYEEFKNAKIFSIMPIIANSNVYFDWTWLLKGKKQMFS